MTKEPEAKKKSPVKKKTVDETEAYEPPKLLKFEKLEKLVVSGE